MSEFGKCACGADAVVKLNDRACCAACFGPGLKAILAPIRSGHPRVAGDPAPDSQRMTVHDWATTPPAKCAAVAAEFNVGYFCDLPPGHDGDHECTCSGHRWPLAPLAAPHPEVQVGRPERQQQGYNDPLRRG